MSILIEQVKTYCLVRGSYRKEFRIPKSGDVTVTTYCRGEHYHTATLTLEEARVKYSQLQRPARGDDFSRGWESF